MFLMEFRSIAHRVIDRKAFQFVIGWQLELVDQRYLKFPWRGVRAGNRAKAVGWVAAADINVRLTVAGNVERVESVGAGFESLFLPGFEAFGKRHVIILESRAALRSDACGSKVLLWPAISASGAICRRRTA